MGAAENAKWSVLLVNDDSTPMEFVVDVIERIFEMDHEIAVHLMLRVHNEGIGECGSYPQETAKAKADQVLAVAREHRHPLQSGRGQGTSRLPLLTRGDLREFRGHVQSYEQFGSPTRVVFTSLPRTEGRQQKKEERTVCLISSGQTGFLPAGYNCLPTSIAYLPLPPVSATSLNYCFIHAGRRVSLPE
jgi:ATP-dependent Clp protease adaptor protein ClpS